VRGLRGNLTNDGVCSYTYECAASPKRSGGDAANRLTAVSFGYDGLPALGPQAQVGSVRQVINPAGSVTLAQGYDPFGNPLTSAGSGGSVFGYTGEQVDASTGLVYLRARYYQPATGRFLMPDPWPGELLDPRSLPPSYIYASGNPANRIDPSGQGGIHSEVELRYAVEYDLEVEYTIPTTVPPNMPSWARWGWRIDLIT
jgi:RHS repeat-associated protein